MTWLTENPIGVYFVLALFGVVSLVVFISTRRLLHLSGVGLAILLGIAVYLIDQAVVTDRELVQQHAKALAKATEDGDLATLDRLFAPHFQMDGHSKESLMAKARRYLNPGAARTITFYDLGAVDVPGGNLLVKANIAASGNFEAFRVDPPFTGTIDLEFARDGEDWRIVRLVLRRFGGAEQTIP